MPEFHLIAGPNGSGKTTFLRDVRSGERTIDYHIPRIIINPDDIAVRMNASNPDAAATRAGREALAQRNAALVARESFGIETTFSGHSERQLVAAAATSGYTVTMTYIALSDVERNVWRVTQRTAIEGRSVLAEDVRRRYERSFRNLATVADTLDAIYLFDNSGMNFKHVLTLKCGQITMLAESIPGWVERALRIQLDRSRG